MYHGCVRLVQASRGGAWLALTQPGCSMEVNGAQMSFNKQVCKVRKVVAGVLEKHLM